MEEKVSSSNRTRADTADVGNTKITGDEAGRITNMTGTATDKVGSVPAGSTRRNLSVEKRHDAKAFTKKLTHEKAGGKLSRSEMQAKTVLDRKRIRKEMTAAMTAVGTIKNGAYVDSNDNEELSEKVASKGVSLAENVSGKVVDTFQDGIGGLKNTTAAVARPQGGKNVDGSLAGSNVSRDGDRYQTTLDECSLYESNFSRLQHSVGAFNSRYQTSCFDKSKCFHCKFSFTHELFLVCLVTINMCNRIPYIWYFHY